MSPKITFMYQLKESGNTWVFRPFVGKIPRGRVSIKREWKLGENQVELGRQVMVSIKREWKPHEQCRIVRVECVSIKREWKTSPEPTHPITSLSLCIN